MFKTIGKFFSAIYELFEALETLCRTGSKVAKQFEAEQDRALALKRQQLAEIKSLDIA